MGQKKKWIITGIAMLLVFSIGIVTVMSMIATVLSVIGGEESQSSADVSMEGLPQFITVEMVEALLEMQDTYGHPVSTGLAQIIVESGFGRYGSGGESGQGLSKLAYQQKNLFGIKYFSGDVYAIGSYNYNTGEQTSSGGNYTENAAFSVYSSYTDCIRQRAWMLERSPYIGRIQEYKKPGNGSYGREQADGFINGIRLAGWATSVSYVEHCTSVMGTYNLYRFDSMTLEQFRSSQGAGDAASGSGQEYAAASEAQKKIVDTAYATRFAGDGLCATWVSRMFANAGYAYPCGNANSFSMSRESGELKVGMVICVQHSGPAASSWNYGHIGIYIGDGKVMHNESSRTGNLSNGCTITDLDAWKSAYEYQCTAYYGWVNSIDLSRQ